MQSILDDDEGFSNENNSNTFSSYLLPHIDNTTDLKSIHALYHNIESSIIELTSK